MDGRYDLYPTSILETYKTKVTFEIDVYTVTIFRLEFDRRVDLMRRIMCYLFMNVRDVLVTVLDFQFSKVGKGETVIVRKVNIRYGRGS